jgi:hypothetical protein
MHTHGRIRLTGALKSHSHDSGAAYRRKACRTYSATSREAVGVANHNPLCTGP